MTRLWNDPTEFADEMIAGFAAANQQYVRLVPGGVARRQATPAGQVAVVVGGGSGHYPAFGGLVGSGLAHGAAMGNLFASPSARQIIGVAEAVENGGGVLFSYGNYAGDVLNFGAAQQRLRQVGIECETVVVTDDVSSAAPHHHEQRRGIAGDLTVFRIAAAAAEQGHDLAEVTRLARLANDRTRSFGVAFSGCTLPGARQPLFQVPAGRMAIGLGIHGEPGIGETAVPTADGVADLLVERLLTERPQDGSRAVPILNGLGSVKYEEMFVVYRRVAQLLDDAGIAITDPHVGEYCTSFDMAGLSLTLLWLDDELDRLWGQPVDAPAYRRGTITAQPAPAAAARATPAEEIPTADQDARAAARLVQHLLSTVARTVGSAAEDLGRLDAVAGDGDHGIGMRRGADAALAAATEARLAGAGASTTLRRAADAWSDRAGGTSGILWGIILGSVAAALADHGTPSAADIAAGVAAGTRQVIAHGGAQVGDKTLVDALVPFSTELSHRTAAGTGLAVSWTRAAELASQAAADTADLVPRRGRARPHAEKSLGTPDPGAYSLALIVTALAGVFTAYDERN